MKRRRKAHSDDLLPHFTPWLTLELQARLFTRMREDALLKDNGARWKFAGEMVSRIFRTQLREAKDTLSFADAVLKAYRKPTPIALPATPKQQPGLVIPFGPKEHARAAARA